MQKTVVITGGSGAIGSACAKKFYDCGYNVAIGYLNGKDAADALSEEFLPERFMAVRADIAVSCGAVSLVEAAYERFGGVDVLVNNAGIALSGLFQDVTEKELQRITAVNVNGAFFASQSAVKIMLKNKSGSIVNVSSMWGEVGSSTEVAYSMTKAALIGFTKALAKELGPSGIRVNCVSPGLIDTPMNDCYTREDLNLFADDTPLCRMGTPEEVAEAVYFLASENSSFITGQILGVSGGYVV